MTDRPVVKRTARALLIDGEDEPELVLIKRTKPGEPPYWITPGGGVEPEDASVVAALHRELDEELGATVTRVVPAFVDTVPYPGPGEEAEATAHGGRVPCATGGPAPGQSVPGEPATGAEESAAGAGGSVTDAGKSAAGAGMPAAEAAGSGAVKVQHFFVCRLASMDLTRRHGPEVDEPRGEYEVVRVPFTRKGIASVDVVPPSLRDYLDSNVEGVLALLADDLV
ncbi:NUDIX domain-containing protein [Streptomyces pactum]